MNILTVGNNKNWSISTLLAIFTICFGLFILNQKAAPAKADYCGVRCTETVEQEGSKTIGCYQGSNYVYGWGPHATPRISKSVCTDPCESAAGSTTTCTTTYVCVLEEITEGVNEGKYRAIWTNTMICETTYTNGDPGITSVPQVTTDAPQIVEFVCCDCGC